MSWSIGHGSAIFARNLRGGVSGRFCPLSAGAVPTPTGRNDNQRFSPVTALRAIPHKTAGLLVLVLGLAACGADGLGGGSSRTELAEALSEYRVVPTGRAYVAVPNAILVMERDLGVAIEQRVTLPNATSLAGENIILLRAQTSRSTNPGSLQLTEVLGQFGGPPAPFTSLNDSTLSSSTDQYGDMTYSVLRPGGDITCVLAFRRSRIGARALPRGSTSLDMMMRNCVSGSVQDALAPLGPSAFGLGGPR